MEQARFYVSRLFAEAWGRIHAVYSESLAWGGVRQGRPAQSGIVHIFWVSLGPPRTAGSKEQNLGYRVPADQLIRMTLLRFIECLPSCKRKGETWLQFRMCRVRSPKVLSLSLQLSLTPLNEEKGYIFPWIKSNTEKTVSVKTMEFISTDIA